MIGFRKPERGEKVNRTPREEVENVAKCNKVNAESAQKVQETHNSILSTVFSPKVNLSDAA